MDNNTGTATATILPAPTPNIVVTKTASRPTMLPGERVTFTITVQNTGRAPSTVFNVTDAVPSAFLNVQTTTPGCSVNGNTVACLNQSALAPGESRTFTLSAEGGTTVAQVRNYATASFANLTSYTGETDVIIQDPNQVDLTLVKGASASNLTPGEAVVYTIVVEANGYGTSNSYTLTDVVPSGFTNVTYEGTPPAGCAIGGNTLTCTNQPGLAAGTTMTFRIRAIASVTGPTTNTATITSRGDANPNNNSATANVVIQPEGEVNNTATSDGGAFTLTKRAVSSTPTFSPAKTLPANGGTVTYEYTVKNNTNKPLYYVSGSDDKCRITYVSGMQNYDIYGPAGVFVRATWQGIPANGTATWTCTQPVNRTTINTATFKFATSYRYDFWGNPSRTGTQTATAQEQVFIAYDPWAACKSNTIWGNTGNWGTGGDAKLYEYTVNADGSLTKTTKMIDAIDASGTDIAISPDGKLMYVINGAGQIKEYDVATGRLIRTITVRFPTGHTWYVNTNGYDNINSLSFGADGRLYFGGTNFSGNAGGTNALYAINPMPGGTTNYTVDVTIVVPNATSTTSAVRYGFAGDFVTLPNGDLLATVQLQNQMGYVGFVIFPRQADGSFGAPKSVGYPVGSSGQQLTRVFGMTYAQGSLWLAIGNYWYRYDTIPTYNNGSNTTYSYSYSVNNGGVGTFWGATGAQEANTSCTSPAVKITKDAVSAPVTKDANGEYTVNYKITVQNTGTGRDCLNNGV